jgi:hypothetical protein
MTELHQGLVEFFSNSPLREASVSILRSVPGLPPILQTLHLLGVAILMASAVMISLRILGVACRRQQRHEMLGRLFPWFLGSLPVMLLSGLPFFLARPQRYLTNPVFTYKILFLLLALSTTFVIWYWYRKRKFKNGIVIQLIALTSVSAWVMTAMAGRWIAYADYIFWPG